MCTMKKIIIRKNGDPQVLEVDDFKMQPDSKNGLLIEVWYVGVGFADIMAQRGGYPLAPKKPFTPGYDFVGRVREAYNSDAFKNGDMVGGLLPVMGTYTELIEVPESRLVKLPGKTDFKKAAASILNYLTAYCILDKKANIQNGETVFIQGVSGGVGIALAQIGKLKKLKMYGTASSSKQEILESYSVESIDYRKSDYERRILDIHPAGIDAAFDARGGSDLLKCSKIVKRGGRIIAYGFSGDQFGGYLEGFKGMLILLGLKLMPNGKKIQMCATPQETQKDEVWYRQSLGRIFAQIAKDDLDPLIDSIFPLENAGEAHALMESGRHQGKILLKTRFCKD